jgi:hypothetical protein
MITENKITQTIELEYGKLYPIVIAENATYFQKGITGLLYTPWGTVT